MHRPVALSALTASLALLAACNRQLALEEPPTQTAPEPTTVSPTPDAGVPQARDAGSLPSGPANPPDATPSADCNDGFKNGSETDVDCGGPCPACPVEANCTGHPDCQSHVCRAATCQAATCADQTKNADETGIDCGGACSPCPTSVVPCNCASSPNLTGIACGPSLYSEESVYLTPGGENVLFALSLAGVYRWDGSNSNKLDSGPSEPKGMSDDGSVMLFTGYWDNNLGATSAAFLLTSEGTRTELPVGDVLALSEDGTVVLGDSIAPGAYVCQRWTARGCENIMDVSGATSYRVSFMTPDGSVLGGKQGDGSDEVQLFTWSGGTEVQLRGALPGVSTRTRNNGVVISRDGKVVAGFKSTSLTPRPDDTIQLFRSTPEGGQSIVTTLWPSGAAPEDPASDTRLWLNDDGSVLVGTFDLDTANQVAEPSAFRWTQETGPVALAASAGQRSVTRGASRDLSVVVGYTLEDDHPFVWTEADGLRDLGSVLGAAAVDQTGWVLSKPSAVSRDGRVIVGQGSCNGVDAVYRAVLPE